MSQTVEPERLYVILNCPQSSLDVAFLSPPQVGVFQMPPKVERPGEFHWALCVMGRLVTKDRKKWSSGAEFRQVREFAFREDAISVVQAIREGRCPPEEMVTWELGEVEATGERVPTAADIERQLRISRHHLASAYAGRHGRRSRWS